MSGFIAGGAPPAEHINTDGFWPSIDLEQMREVLHIESGIDSARLETAVIAAAININRGLAAWQADQQAKGFTRLADVPAGQVRGISTLVRLYIEAVQAATGAEVIERYGDQDGHDINALLAQRDGYRRDQRWALRDLVGRPRVNVELL
ncbi:head completion/stabilization protein [Pseudomonas mangiferae]|uniref:Head completion/stabilization protein n=1 Tax=Pseudomonas mangiferae TaxID=2593654 RepID=A0A553H0J3_9PSED|nr:head completion/stabilization protein [Pseudomonas mangiferae]TRX75267.1 head completion/stabilization protein [Pseudomonas mangiferae]